MAYYPDLSVYTYSLPGGTPTTLNVGWLDKNHAYPQAEVPNGFAERLWHFCWNSVLQTRGLHECAFCPPTEHYVLERCGVEEQRLGSAEIRIFGQNGVIYAAPDLIYHYVVRHQYCPPAEFIQAVLDGPLPGSLAYKECAMRYDWFEDAQWWWEYREKK